LPPARRKEKLPMQILKYSLQQLKKRFLVITGRIIVFLPILKKLAANSAKRKKPPPRINY